MGRMRAVTIGQVVLADCSAADEANLVAHELCHVHQSLAWGPLFAFAYLASSVAALWRGQDLYWHNRFEVAARAAETAPTPGLLQKQKPPSSS